MSESVTRLSMLEKSLLAERDELRSLLGRAQALFPIERPEEGGDPEWVAAIKRDVREALDA